MFTTESEGKPCYLPENNRYDCKQVQGALSSNVELEEKLRSNKDDDQKIHVCMFCGQGLKGGRPCGNFCGNVLKENICNGILMNCRQRLTQRKGESSDEYRYRSDSKQVSSTTKKEKRKFIGICLKKKKVLVKRPSILYIGNPNNLLREENGHDERGQQRRQKRFEEAPFLRSTGLCICQPFKPQTADAQTSTLTPSPAVSEQFIPGIKIGLTEKRLPFKSKSERLPRKKFHYICSTYETSDESDEVPQPPPVIPLKTSCTQNMETVFIRSKENIRIKEKKNLYDGTSHNWNPIIGGSESFEGTSYHSSHSLSNTCVSYLRISRKKPKRFILSRLLNGKSCY